MNQEQVNDIIHKYQIEQISIDNIAKIYKRCFKTIQKILIENKIIIRKPFGECRKGKTLKKKYSIEEVRMVFENNNCILLSNSYNGCDTYLDFICSCGKKDKRLLNNFKKYPRCKNCQLKIRVDNRTSSYDDILNVFKKENCILLTTKENYKNNKTKVDYICSCGNQSKIVVNSFMSGRRCNKCGDEKRIHNTRYGYEFVKKYIEFNSNCILITTAEEYVNSKQKINLKCDCGDIFTTSFTNFKNENKIRCNKCSFKLNSGENSRLWKGGTSSERDSIKNTDEYKAWRNSIFKRDKYTCQCCGDNKGGNLSAHHILNFSNNKELRFEIDNGISLCENCHNPSIKNSFHYVYGTRNNNKEQLEEYIELNKKINQNNKKINYESWNI